MAFPFHLKKNVFISVSSISIVSVFVCADGPVYVCGVHVCVHAYGGQRLTPVVLQEPTTLVIFFYIIKFSFDLF